MPSKPGPLSLVPLASVDHMMGLVLNIGAERFLLGLAGYIEDDFRRWRQFDKTPRDLFGMLKRAGDHLKASARTRF